MRPLHLDFTTLFGAALAIEEKALRQDGLPLSRLLALSQLVEGIVLNESLQFELGTSDLWRPYREALESTLLFHLVREHALPLIPCEEEVDASELAIARAGDWAASAALAAPIETLEWAVRFRSGTYDAISTIVDRTSPITSLYLQILRKSPDKAFRCRLESALQRLQSNEVGVLGLHVLMRVRLIEMYFVDAGRAHYAPHYSRQPLLLATGDEMERLHSWSMDELREKREAIFGLTEPTRATDVLALALSPIFLACIDKARSPAQVLDAACALRVSRAATEYRREISQINERSADEGESAVQLFKMRLRLAIENVRDLLFERGVRQEYIREWNVKLGPSIPLGWGVSWRRNWSANLFPGDRAALFLSDVLSQALGVLSAQNKIGQVFDVPVAYDTHVISCAKPMVRRAPPNKGLKRTPDGAA
jgi:hypothetical protein